MSDIFVLLLDGLDHLWVGLNLILTCVQKGIRALVVVGTYWGTVQDQVFGPCLMGMVFGSNMFTEAKAYGKGWGDVSKTFNLLMLNLTQNLFGVCKEVIAHERLCI